MGALALSLFLKKIFKAVIFKRRKKMTFSVCKLCKRAGVIFMVFSERKRMELLIILAAD